MVSLINDIEFIVLLGFFVMRAHLSLFKIISINHENKSMMYQQNITYRVTRVRGAMHLQC